MPNLDGLTVLDGATVTPSGGTSQVFVKSGTEVSNGYEVVDSGDSDFLMRDRIVGKIKPYTKLPDGSYSKQKTSFAYTSPIEVNGVIHYNVFRVEAEIHPATDAAEVTRLRSNGSQLCIDSELDDCYEYGNL
jgi:hypothetical protein